MTTVEFEPAQAPERMSWRSLPPLALVPLAGLAWWVAGFLPWLLDGLGSQYELSTLTLPLFAGNVGGLVLGAGLGGVLGGLVACVGAGSRAVRAGACATGVAIALSATLVQSRSAGGIGDDQRITNGLTIVVLIVAMVGLGIGLLGVTGRIGLGLALGAAAGAASMWATDVFHAVGLGDTAGELEWVHRVSEWSGALLLVAALVAVGLRPTIHAVAWPGVVVLAWFIRPTITAASYMDVFLRPGMSLTDLWGDHLSATMDVWRMSASTEARPLRSWFVAVGVALCVSLWLARRPSSPPVP